MDEEIVAAKLTIDTYWTWGYRVSVRADGTAFVQVRDGYREFRTERAACRWCEDHFKI